MKFTIRKIKFEKFCEKSNFHLGSEIQANPSFVLINLIPSRWKFSNLIKKTKWKMFQDVADGKQNCFLFPSRRGNAFAEVHNEVILKISKGIWLWIWDGFYPPPNGYPISPFYLFVVSYPLPWTAVALRAFSIFFFFPRLLDIWTLLHR